MLPDLGLPSGAEWRSAWAHNVVKVLASDGSVVGAGFLVGGEGKLIVTCAHVAVAGCGLAELRAGTADGLRVQFEGDSRELRTRLFDDVLDASKDICVLELLESAPIGRRGLGLELAAPKFGGAARTMGFPPALDRAVSDNEVVLESAQKTRDGAVRLQLRSANITNGFSGSPLVDGETGRVVGVVTEVIATDGNGKLGSVAYATPVSDLLAMLRLNTLIDSWRRALGLRVTEVYKVIRDIFGRFDEIAASSKALDPRAISFMHQVQDYLCGALSATELAAGLSSESDDQVENETLVELIARGNIAFFVGSRFFLDLGIQISADQIARDLSEDEPAPSSLSRASHLWQMSKGRRALRESLKQALSARDIQSPKLNQVAENLRNGRPLLAVTTFYDDVLEKTLAKALVRVQVVSRAPVEDAAESGRQRNELVSGLQVLTMDQSGGHTRSTIDNLSNARPLESGYSLVYRLCGGVSFEQETSLDADTLVVAEPDFFEFARSADHVLPDYIVRHLKNKNVFFLGCDLSSWNECLVLYSLIKHLRGCKERLYAVQHKPTNYDREFWRVSGISLVEEGLEAFFQRIGTAQL